MSAPIVCNCNNYGKIDYGMPLGEFLPDYRTSTYRGLRHIPPVTQEFYGFNLDPYKGNHVEVKYDIYNTQNNLMYDIKSPISSEKAYIPPRYDKNNYLRNFKEICYRNPPMPKNHYISECSDQYILKTREPFREIPGVQEQTTCQMSVTGKAEQPRIKTEEPGIIKHLDIYMTTTQNSYPPYSPKQMEKAKTHAVTFWETKTNTDIQNCNYKKPIYDERLFRTPVKDRILPALVYRIPFKGKTSEYQSNYAPPTKSCFYTRMNKTDVKFQDDLSKPNMSQTLAAPNMYCTEYCHVGTGRAVCAAVARKYERKVKTHPICGDHY